MFTLDAESLRELAATIDDYAERVPDDEHVTTTAQWSDLLHAVRAAVAAVPWCPCCAGFGEIELPARGDVHGDGDTETVVCPLCRPWAQGFPGQRDPRRGIGAALTDDGGWIIPPYEAGEQPSKYRGEPIDLDVPGGF